MLAFTHSTSSRRGVPFDKLKANGRRAGGDREEADRITLTSEVVRQGAK
jgi:hypothetical protein